jgi:hypothetical protein
LNECDLKPLSMNLGVLNIILFYKSAYILHGGMDDVNQLGCTNLCWMQLLMEDIGLPLDGPVVLVAEGNSVTHNIAHTGKIIHNMMQHMHCSEDSLSLSPGPSSRTYCSLLSCQLCPEQG